MLNIEVTKELADKVYQLVEKVKVDGRLRKGGNETTKSVERGEAKLVVIAEDVNPKEVVMHLPILCKEKQIPIISVPARSELGAAAGLPVSTSAIAIADAGESKRLLADVVKYIDTLTKTKAAPIEKAEISRPPSKAEIIEKEAPKTVERKEVRDEKPAEKLKEEKVEEKKEKVEPKKDVPKKKEEPKEEKPKEKKEEKPKGGDPKKKENSEKK